MTDQTVAEILTVMNQMELNIDREVTTEMVEEICRRFNDKLKFKPELHSNTIIHSIFLKNFCCA
jgi:hypothetical protein